MWPSAARVHLMITNVLTKIFGSRNERLLKQYSRAVGQINALEAGLAALGDAELRAKTDELRQRHAAGISLDELLPEAVVRGEEPFLIIGALAGG